MCLLLSFLDAVVKFGEVRPENVLHIRFQHDVRPLNSDLRFWAKADIAQDRSLQAFVLNLEHGHECLLPWLIGRKTMALKYSVSQEIQDLRVV